MPILDEPSIKDLIIVHIIFAILCVVVLTIPVLLSLTLAIGYQLLLLVAIYNVMIPLVGYKRGHKEWMDIWTFVFPLSLLMILPDWFLSAQLGSLVFPIDGSPMIGDIPIYMAGLWGIPLFIIVYVGMRLKESQSALITLLGVCLVTLIIFMAAEEYLWMIGSWYAYPGLKAMLSHVAVYIIIPEIALGASAFIAYDMVKETHIVRKTLWAYIVMIMYIGNAAFFYFIVEGILLP